MPITAIDIQDAAFLSQLAYRNSASPNGPIGPVSPGSSDFGEGWQVLSYAQLGLQPATWNDGDTDLDNSAYVYDRDNSQAIVAVKGNKIVLAFRGSEQEELSDFWEAAKNQTAHYQSFEPLISAFNSYILGKNLDVIVTGHSLGAAMAQLYITNDGRAIDTPKLITFGSPGINPGANGGLAVGTVAEGSIQFVHTGDPITYSGLVNGSGNLQGNVVHVDLPDFQDGPHTSGYVSVATQLGIAAAFSAVEVGIYEHTMSAYSQSVDLIAASPTLSAQFLAEPAAFAVERSSLSHLVGDGGRDYLIGSDTDQELNGAAGADLIAGRGGKDVIYGGAGADYIEGGRGDDYIDGGNDADNLDGGADNDNIRGGDGNDTIDGGSGFDTARYDFSAGNYTVLQVGNHFTVQMTSGNTTEGFDEVYNVEQFEFSGKVFTPESLLRTTTGSTTTIVPTTYGDSPGGGVVSTTTAITNGTLDILDTTRTTAQMTAGTAASPSPFASTIGFAGDVDYIKVNLVEGAVYRFLVEGIAANGMSALADTFFRIRDGRDLSQLNPAALSPTNLDNHDQAVGTNAQLDFTAPYSGLYFVSVGAGGANYASLTGGYRLTANLITPSAVLPSNHNPTAGADQFDAYVGRTINGSLLGNDSDIDSGNVLSVDAVGSFHTSKGGIVDVVANGAFQYIAPGSGTGTDTFTYTLRDGAGGSAQATVTINLLQPSVQLPQMPEFTNGSDVATIPVVPSGAGWIFYALDGNDILNGSPGRANGGGLYQVFGGDGDDTFNANGQGGLLHGGAGNDTFIASAGGPDAETFDGDTLYDTYNDSDTADFSALGSRVVADMAAGTVISGGRIFTIWAIENIVGTEFGDEMRGVGTGNTLSINNVFSGLGGNDLLMGYVGNDDIYGGTGDDSLYGGDGDDRIFGGDGSDDLHGGNGGAQDGRNLLDGGAGSDFVYGGSGDDVLDGGPGDDFIAGDDGFGQPGNDFIRASAGTDRVRGLDGIDTVDFSNAPTGASGGGNVTVSGWGTTTLEEIEIVIGTSFDDQLNAAAGWTELRLGSGNDFGFASGNMSMWGDDGDDRLFGNAADETFYGGNGNDGLYLNDGTNHGFGGAGDDTILGGSGADELQGDAGNDVLDAGGGADMLRGGDGDDTLAGGGGNDDLDGGNGIDTADYSAAQQGVTLYLYDGIASGADTGSDTLASIENVKGGNGGDNLTGDSNANVFAGNGGNDAQFGGAGHDTLSGDDGDDTLVGNADTLAQESDTLSGGAGDDSLYGEFTDTIDGGTGRDVLYAVNDFAWSINLGTTSVEYMQAGFGGDTINAATQSAAVEIFAGGGNDIVTGSGFADFLWAGVGDDTVTGGEGGDMLFGDLGADSLSGGGGNDRLYIDGVDTTVDGGAGFDAVYITSGTGRTFDMAATGIEWVADGANGNDTYNGAALAVDMTVYAGGGTDTLTGGSGADFLWGEAGTDTITGGIGNDVLVGGTGADVLTGGTGTDVVYLNSGGGSDGALDRVVFTAGWGTDFVFDFVHGEDKIDLTAFGTTFAALDFTNSFGHAYVHIGAGTDLIAVANNGGLLTAGDFLF